MYGQCTGVEVVLVSWCVSTDCPERFTGGQKGRKFERLRLTVAACGTSGIKEWNAGLERSFGIDTKFMVNNYRCRVLVFIFGKQMQIRARITLLFTCPSQP